MGELANSKGLRKDNRDLKTFCCRLLVSEAVTDLQYRIRNGKLNVTTLNLDRIELYLDDRPQGESVAVAAGETTNSIAVGDEWWKLELLGFQGGVRQRRIIRPDRQ